MTIVCVGDGGDGGDGDVGDVEGMKVEDGNL